MAAPPEAGSTQDVARPVEEVYGATMAAKPLYPQKVMGMLTPIPPTTPSTQSTLRALTKEEEGQRGAAPASKAEIKEIPTRYPTEDARLNESTDEASDHDRRANDDTGKAIPKHLTEKSPQRPTPRREAMEAAVEEKREILRRHIAACARGLNMSRQLYRRKLRDKLNHLTSQLENLTYNGEQEHDRDARESIKKIYNNDDLWESAAEERYRGRVNHAHAKAQLTYRETEYNLGSDHPRETGEIASSYAERAGIRAQRNATELVREQIKLNIDNSIRLTYHYARKPRTSPGWESGGPGIKIPHKGD